MRRFAALLGARMAKCAHLTRISGAYTSCPAKPEAGSLPLSAREVYISPNAALIPA